MTIIVCTQLKMCMCVSPPALCIFAICVLLAGIFVCLGIWVLVYVRMLHPSATACQDVPSFVRWPFRPLCVYVCVCVSGRLGPCVCQDAPSFGNSLSRCSIFRQVTLLSSVCVYVCVSGRLGPRVCQDAPSFGNSLSRCSIFRQVTLLSSVCVCVCVWAFGSLCMSGCSILRQQPVKMFHLSSGDPFVLCVCVYVSGRLGPCVCQDAPSFGNSLSRCSIFCQVTLSSSVCLSTSMFVCVCQHLCVSEGDGWVYIQCICFISVTKTRYFF